MVSATYWLKLFGSACSAGRCHPIFSNTGFEGSDTLRDMARDGSPNQTHYWSSRATPGVSLLHADFKTMNFRPHTHDSYVIAVTEVGGSVIRSRGDEFEVSDQLLMVFNPDEPHEGWLGTSDRWRYRSLYVSKSATDLIAECLELDRIPRFNSNGFADRQLCRAFLTMHRLLGSKSDAGKLRESFLDSFCALFERHSDKRNSRDRLRADHALLKKAIAIMEDNYGDKLLLDDLGAAVDLTPFQLITLYKRCTGLTPHSYLVQIRLRNACRMLRRGVSIAEASFASGFYDQAAMTNQFKRTFAITPMQYALAWRPADSVYTH
jgi:AraC-like DNA-binding protein